MEAHGTGTALGDPIEVSSISAIVSKQGRQNETCSVCAIKGNVGHTESTAGVANVIEVINVLMLGETALNTQLRVLNPQVRQVRTEDLCASAESNSVSVLSEQRGGASSFGWSGIIAHGVFQQQEHVGPARGICGSTSISVYRQCAPASRERKVMHSMLAGVRDAQQIDDAVLSTGTLAVLSHHVVGGNILLPGVGYVEMAFAAVAGRLSLIHI